MKKTLKIMLAALLSLAMVLTFAGAADLEATVTATAPANDTVVTIHAEDGALDAFADAPANGDWSYEALNCIVANELMKGNNSLLSPSALLSRAEMTTIMVRVLGAEGLSANISKYVDVKRGEWYYNAISAGVATKIINGSGNKMMPKDSITREQAMAILARTFLFEAETNATATYKDKKDISSWALDAANALVEREIVLGDAKGNLRPKANITRAEFATMLHRIVCYFADAKMAYAGKTIKGSVIISDADIDLSGATIEGDLYITEGVGDAKLDLSDVTVNGRIVIRSGDVKVPEDTDAEIVRIEDEPVVVPPVKDDKNETVNKDTPNVSTTPNGADVIPVEIDEAGTYVSYNNGAAKVYADVTGDTITFDLSNVDGSETLKDLYVKANKRVAIKTDGFHEVNYNTNEEIPVTDLLIDMLDSTSRSISQMLGITDAEGNVAGDYSVAKLADMVETAQIFYTLDSSEDLWMQKLFDNRGISFPGDSNEVAFTATIGGKEYTIVLIVPAD